MTRSKKKKNPPAPQARKEKQKKAAPAPKQPPIIFSFNAGQKGYLVSFDKKLQKPGMVDEIISFFETFADSSVPNGDCSPENNTVMTGIAAAERKLQNLHLSTKIDTSLGGISTSHAVPQISQPICNGESNIASTPKPPQPQASTSAGAGQNNPKPKQGVKSLLEVIASCPSLSKEKVQPNEKPVQNTSPGNGNKGKGRPSARQIEKRKLFYEMQRKTENMARPQLKFETPVINDDLPFMPKLPLVFTLIRDPKTGRPYYEHPYKDNIKHWLPPPPMLCSTKENGLVMELKNTPHYYVDSIPYLRRMMKELHQVTEISFDVEHSDRGYLGLTCLIQISTRFVDYIVDCFTLRDHLHCLNEVFTHPEIVKVAHSAHCDVAYLQRDFGIYVVGLFDTCEAEKTIVSDKKSAGLAALLLKYFGIELDKRYQLADWRIRPLTSAMRDYARSDTHYLLKLYDFQKAQLLKDGDYKPLFEVYENSKEICLIRYDKPDYNDWIRKNTGKLNNRQMYAVEQLNEKRKETASLEDDNLHFIASNKTLLALSTALPHTWEELLDAVKSGHGYLTPFISNNRQCILNVMNEARKLPLEVVSVLKYDRDDSKRVLVGQVLKPKAANSLFLLSKTNNPSEIVHKIMEKCHVSEDITFPGVMKRILPVQTTCEKEISCIVGAIQLLLLEYEHLREKVSYGISTNFAPKFKSELLSVLPSMMGQLQPNWNYSEDLIATDYCLAVYNVETVYAVSIVKSFGKYKGFFMKSSDFVLD